MGGRDNWFLVVLTLGNPGTPMGRSLIYWPHQRHLWLILERPSGFSFHLAFFSHAMEMNAPEILICESALKVKIEQSYGIWNWHKVCLNKFQMKNANLSTFSFYARSFFWPHQRHLWLILERPSGLMSATPWRWRVVCAPEILICESALKVKIEQSYGIWNRHKVCPNENLKKSYWICQLFPLIAFCCLQIISWEVADRWRPWFWVSAAHLGRRDDTPSQ